MATLRPGRLSAGRYFLYVAMLTVMGIATLSLVLPNWAHAVKSLLGLERPPTVAPSSFYVQRIAPLFEEHCSSCHGARRQKANLRLDNLAYIVRGGKHGEVIKAGNLRDSELFSRIRLPASNDQVMPPKSKAPLSGDEITVVRLWIAAGASGVQPSAAFSEAPKAPVRVAIPDIDATAVTHNRASHVNAVRALQRRLLDVIQYQSRASADLEVHATSMGRSFGDVELALLVEIGAHIVWADFSDTAITDASAGAIKTMQRLRVLRLANTRISGSMVPALVSLNQLQSVTVVGTAITEASLRPLKDRHVMIHGNDEMANTLNARP